VALVYINLRLYRALRMRRRRLTSRARLHNNVTMMLIAIVSVFVVCELPDVILRLIVAVQKLITGDENVDAFVHRAHCVTNVLLAVNSSVNFIIYFLVGNKFREILARQCGCESGSWRQRLGDRARARFLHTPDTGSTGGVDGGSCFAERPDGFVWSSRRAGGGRGFAPRSPTTEHAGWRRATIVDGLLAVQRLAAPGVTSVVELEICPCQDALQDGVDETAAAEQHDNDIMIGTN